MTVNFETLVDEATQAVLKRNYSANGGWDSETEVLIHNDVEIALELARETYRELFVETPNAHSDVQPRAVDYAHLVGRYVRMERLAVEGEPDFPGGTVGMEGVVAEVHDAQDGVAVVADYGYGFKLTADDAHLWRWHVWPDQRTRDLFAVAQGFGDRPVARPDVRANAEERANALALSIYRAGVVLTVIEQRLHVDGRGMDLPDRLTQVRRALETR